MKDLVVTGVGNGLLDILLRISEQEFAKLQVEKGTMRLVEEVEQNQLLQNLSQYDAQLAGGGSVANSIIALSQLGSRASFLTQLGDDRYGLFYLEEFKQLGIEAPVAPLVGQRTGTCVSLITPDAERSMRTCLGVAAKISAQSLDEATIARSQWIFLEGYVLANPEFGPAAILAACELAKRNATKIAFTFSEAFIPQVFKNLAEQVVQVADLVFANEAEACSFTGESKAEAAFHKLRAKVPSVVVSAGAQGAYVAHGGIHGHVPAFACEPVDLTGAGDMVAGAFIHGISQKIDPLRSARAACFMASKVITQVGARLRQGAKQSWEQGLRG